MNPVFCRMCLKDPPVDSLVFSVYDTFQGRPLVELIDELFSIKVIVEDRLLNVCLECVNKIHSVQKISRLFVTNNDKLQNMLHGEETEAIGIDEETESVGYEEMHSDETSTGGQNPHRQPNGRGETEEVLLTIERNTQEIEELYLDTDAKCRIARRVEEVNDKLPTDERVNQKRQLSVKQSELNRKCYFCGMIFGTSLEFTNHLTLHIHQVPYTCPECNGITLQSVQQASKHIGMHDRTDRPYGCRVCSLRFTSKDRSLSHERKMHRYKLKKQAEKNQNRKSIATVEPIKNIRYHHSKLKPFNCQLCGRSFTLKGNLNRHMGMHTGEKLHKCTECDKGFWQSTQRNIHLRRHHPNAVLRLQNNRKNSEPSENSRAAAVSNKEERE